MFRQFGRRLFSAKTGADPQNSGTQGKKNVLDVREASRAVISAVDCLHLRTLDNQEQKPVNEDRNCQIILDSLTLDWKKIRTKKIRLGKIVQSYRSLVIDRQLNKWLSSTLLQYEFTADGSQLGKPSSSSQSENQVKHAHVIELGTGLDYRLDRMLNSKQGSEFFNELKTERPDCRIFSHEIDIHEIIDIRKELTHSVLKQDCNENILLGPDDRLYYSVNLAHPSSIDLLVDAIKRNIEHELGRKQSTEECMDFSNVCFIAEALFAHFPKKTSMEMCSAMIDEFPNATLIFDEAMGAGGFYGLSDLFPGKRRYIVSEQRIRLMELEPVVNSMGFFTRKFILPMVRKLNAVVTLKFAPIDFGPLP